jgi:uncharacterized phage infection (PIP) family protein YhgE
MNDKQQIALSRNNNVYSGNNYLAQLETDINKTQKNVQQLISHIESAGSHIGDLEGHWYTLNRVSAEDVRQQLTYLNTEMSECFTKTAQLIRSSNENQRLTFEMIKGLLFLQQKIYDHVSNETESIKDLNNNILDWCKKTNLTDSNLSEFISLFVTNATKEKEHFQNIDFIIREINQSINALQTEIKSLSDRQQKLSNELKQINVLQTEIKSLSDRQQKLSNELKQINTLQTEIKSLSNRQQQVSNELKQIIKYSIPTKWKIILYVACGFSIVNLILIIIYIVLQTM